MSLKLSPGLVSVIVASYNHAEYLKSRMESLIQQTYSNIEIIVIDDCSSDNSWQVLQDYIEAERVNIVRNQTNEGWVKVSNQGAKLAKGEYILFANCDDACDINLIQSLVDKINESRNIGLVFCRSKLIDSADNFIGDDYEVREKSFKLKCEKDTIISKSEMKTFLLNSCVIPNLSAALMKKEAFSFAGGFSSKYRACSDWELFFRIADKYQFGYIAEPFNYFRQHATTIRSLTSERITYDEYFQLLLTEIKNSELSTVGKIGFQFHAMYLWAIYLMKPPFFGWLNFFHHSCLVFKIDPLALIMLPIALIIRFIQIPVKLWQRF